MAYQTETRAAQNTLEFRAYLKDSDGKPISPWHDIPLYANEEKTVINMVCEVPRWSNAKMEISKELPLNPIIQDTKKGKLRFVHNCFPHHGYIWNYGGVPQTWENPETVDKHTECKGDNDPIDICEIGERVASIGEVKQVKVLGIMAMIDEGETDWKVLAIDVNDPAADQMNDVEDIEKHFPGYLAATREWFRIYKIPAGKPENTFAFKGEAKNREFAMGIIAETNEAWKQLMASSHEKIALQNTTQEGSGALTTAEAAQAVIDANPPSAPATPVDPSVDKWHYVRL